jgi:hypothetical protein
MRAALLFLLKFAVLFALIASVYTMGDLSIVYLLPPFPTDIDFLMFKQEEIRKPLWAAAFYTHISVSVLCLATGLTQFSRSILQQAPAVHRLAGKIYVFGVLFLAAPTGLFMGFYGEGGIWAQIAFVCQALAWWGLTYMGYIRIRRGDATGHFAFMLRSYAVAMSAITLRGMTYLLTIYKDYKGWDCTLGEAPSFFCHPTYYIFVAWVSWVFNWLLAEILLKLGIARYYFPTKKASATEKL